MYDEEHEPPLSTKFKNSCKYALLCVLAIPCICFIAAAPWDHKSWYKEVTTRKERRSRRRAQQRIKKKERKEEKRKRGVDGDRGPAARTRLVPRSPIAVARGETKPELEGTKPEL
jgi:hypothetical protein